MNKLPQYSGKDYLVLGIVLGPVTLAVNSFIFGSRYFSDGAIFMPATLITALLFCFQFTLCGAIAMMLKRRMPDERETPRRLFLMITTFVGLSGVVLLTLFNGYELFPTFHYRFNESGFIWAYGSMAILNIFLTLLMEGISRYNTWRDNLVETEQMKKTFTQSQLLGLKSQVNPHFLFNSLNTLSSLIAEDEKEAEKFLNEMSKVYRYMLGVDEDQLVTLQTELRFIESYKYLLSKRYGQSLQVSFDIDPADEQKLVPPLSLQVLIENAFTQNIMSKDCPLRISIKSDGRNCLSVCNNRRPKTVCESIDLESGLDNLVAKYQLLNALHVEIRDEVQERSITLPLIEKGGYA